ncbi:xylose isomerase-like protein [Meredithblackwellia eburnea MCA 4105]
MTPELGIASLSLGSFEHHSLPSKLAAASRAGFASIELFDLDWWAFRDSYAKEQNLPPSTKDGDATSMAAAVALGALVQSFGLTISCWQPLRNFEGFIEEEDIQQSRDFAKGILDIMPALGTTLILCCTTSTGAPKTSGDLDRCVRDLTWLADEAAKYNPPIRVMYEGLSFAAHRRRWQDAWEVVEKVNRPNLGLCLDSFNTLALEWADPYSSTGTLSSSVDSQLESNMAELVDRVPGDKVFFFQVADGRRMNPPMQPPTDPTIPRIRPWSRGNRLFPLESSLGAYLPVDQFADAVVKTGYTGPWSLEVFNDSLSDPSDTVPDDHARRAMKGLKMAVEQALSRSSTAAVSVGAIHKL